MRLRVRHPKGTITLDSIQPDDTVLALREQIANTIGEHFARIQVAGGYPPKPFKDDTQTVEAVGIRNGDALNATVVSEPTNTPATATVTTATTQKLPKNLDDDETVTVAGGALVLRTMEDDNSCLFRSLGKYVLEKDTENFSKLRKVVATCIANDPVTYSDVTLGQDRDKYIQWIQQDSSWGGAIELAILSAYYGVEIDSIDVQTGRIDKFGEGRYPERVLVVYSGIHYDALGLSPAAGFPPAFDQTRFNTSDNEILIAAQELVEKLRRKHKYTDVANFTLKCDQCQAGLVGEKDARAHAASTGHTQFVEYQ
ncbi:hypothetical protein VTP01DRAFT_7466 [Rhizomucor pusillus]|uniref:uncharacterized protein n=1 Tax=Rhizomucor pusillus TaxID=4840 RepID=UPI003744118E